MTTTNSLPIGKPGKSFYRLHLVHDRYHNGTKMSQAKKVHKIDTGKRDFQVSYGPRLKDPKLVKTKVSGKHKQELARRAEEWRTSESNYLRMLIETFLVSGMEINPGSQHD